MTSVATSKTTIPASVASSILSRLLDEGYGPGAWHGADLRAAVADVSDTTAFWRPGEARHNIAEVALHHAFCAHSVIGQLTGKDAGPFVIDGSDWFELSGSPLTWEAVRSARPNSGWRAWSPTSDPERLRHRSTVGSSSISCSAWRVMRSIMPGRSSSSR